MRFCAAVVCVAFASLLTLVPACAAEPLGIVTVNVRTGLVPGPEFRFVTIEVFDSTDGTAGNRLEYRELDARFGDEFAAGRRVDELEFPAGVHRITVRLLRPDRRLLVALSQLVSITAGGARVSTFHLTRGCVGDVVCPSPGGSAALSECLAGHCVDPRCEPPDPTHCMGLTFCNSAADCPSVALCAEMACADGICIEEPVSGACAATEYCHPVFGCTSVDSPIEPGEVECGEFCEGACTAGIWACDDEGPRCSVVSFKDRGVSCNGTGTCDGEGTCSTP